MTPNLVLLPGLGVGPDFLHLQRDAFPELIIPRWIDPEPRESLSHYAERLAATVRPSGPTVVGGVSMGGMLAQEMARHMDARAVILIASCTNPSAINPLLRICERCSRIVPGSILTGMRPLGAHLIGLGESLPRQERRLLGPMMLQVTVPLLRWGGRAIFEWPGVSRPAAPTHQIHGSRDRIISPADHRAATIVPGGAHLLNLSHPREVNEFVRACLARSPM